MHRYADSAAQFEQAVQLDSKNYIFWGNLGDAYYWAPGRRSVSCRSLGTPTRRPVVCVPEMSPKHVTVGIQLNGLFKLGSRIGITMHLKIGRGQVGTRVPRRANA